MSLFVQSTRLLRVRLSPSFAVAYDVGIWVPEKRPARAGADAESSRAPYDGLSRKHRGRSESGACENQWSFKIVARMLR